MRRFLSSATLVVAFVIAAGTRPGLAAQDPQTFIANLGNEAIQVMGPQVPYEKRVARFHQIFRNDFAVEQIGQFVLGPYARSATPEQKQQFLRTFETSVVEAYARRFGDYAGDPFRVAGVRREGDETLVSSQITRRNGAPVTVDWSVVDEGGQPKITDVKIGDVSMRVQERELFASLMQQSGGRMDIALIALRNANAPQYGSSTR